jgi:hypothetical protein
MYPHFATPPDRVIGYTAGFVDGEGSISLQGNRYQVTVSQSEINDGEAICRWLQETWGFGIVYGQNKTFRHNYQQWMWSIAQARAVEHLLATCLPDLRVKRKKAIQALEWVQRHIAEGRRVHWSTGEDQWLLDHWDQADWQLAEAMGRTAVSIRHRRHRLGHNEDRRSRPGARRQLR